MPQPLRKSFRIFVLCVSKSARHWRWVEEHAIGLFVELCYRYNRYLSRTLYIFKTCFFFFFYRNSRYFCWQHQAYQTRNDNFSTSWGLFAVQVVEVKCCNISFGKHLLSKLALHRPKSPDRIRPFPGQWTREALFSPCLSSSLQTPANCYWSIIVIDWWSLRSFLSYRTRVLCWGQLWTLKDFFLWSVLAEVWSAAFHLYWWDNVYSLDVPLFDLAKAECGRCGGCRRESIGVVIQVSARVLLIMLLLVT